MTVEKLRKAQSAKPFRPFKIRVSGGGIHDVPHPEFLWFPPNSRTFVVADSDGAIAVIDLLLVGELLFEAELAEASRTT